LIELLTVNNAYFMRVDNRVTQVPPLRTREADHEATSRSLADNRRNRTRGELPQNPNRTRASACGPSQGGNSTGGAGGCLGAAAHGDAGGGGSGGGSSSHGAGRRAGGGGDRGGRGHADNHITGVSRGGYDARRRIEEIRYKKSSTAGENDGFPAFSARLCNLLLPEKFKPLGITKYDAKQDPVQWLRCYSLSIESAGGNNDTKCLYFPFCLDQAPLTWLESLKKYSIDKWDQLKEQFTSNFAGAMGRSGTRMDLAMVKQEQGETLRKYMRRFFDKRATIVDVTDKEVIDLFQDGLYHYRTFEDFGRHRLSSITKLKDMITSWADDEDKANAKYDAHGKSKQNAGGSNNNNRDQGGRNNNYSGPNRKRKPDNTVAAIQRPAKDNSKKTSGGFKDLLKEKCLWHLEVADFKTSYHAILDRPAITKFMALPHYTYLILKMPSPAGVLSLQGDLKISFDCDTEAVEPADTNQVPNAMMEIYAASKKLTQPNSRF
jgi:hypothetical protein